MSSGADAIVVGAGIVGTTIAYVLSRRGLDVRIMDGAGVGSGSTGHGSGGISLVGKDFRPGAHFDLGLSGARGFAEFVERLKEDSGVDPQYHELPGLSLAINEEEEQIYRAELETRGSDLDLQWLEVDEYREMEPRITRDAIGAILYRHGQVDAYRMSIAATTALERCGGSLVSRNATGLLREGSRVVGVTHDAGSLLADVVILTMGAWVGQARDWIGFPIPVRPLHGETLHVRLPGEPLPVFIVTARHGPILPRRDGILLVGSIGGVTMSGMDVDAEHVFDPADETEPEFDLEPKPENRDLMIDCALRIMPALEEAEFLAHLAGVRPLSADRMPIIGPVPGIEGLLLATGHGTKGIHLAPMTALIAADYVMCGENRQDVQADAFLPDRFANAGAPG